MVISFLFRRRIPPKSKDQASRRRCLSRSPGEGLLLRTAMCWTMAADGDSQWCECWIVFTPMNSSGWWYGTFFIFHILGIIIPLDFHIFQRGRSTTNQVCTRQLPHNFSVRTCRWILRQRVLKDDHFWNKRKKGIVPRSYRNMTVVYP